MTTTTTHQAIEQEQSHIAQTYKRPNFVLSHGKGMSVWDTNGKEYLDFVAGIAVMALGHSHDAVLKAVHGQANQLMHVSNLYYTKPQSTLAEKLTSNSFADRVFFCNSGAEANEACMKFARKYARSKYDHEKTEIITFTKGFHGRTFGALSITPKEKYQAPFAPLVPNITVLPLNDIEAFHSTISDKTCAVVVEPIQGEGGINPTDAELLQALRAGCDEVDALLVFDEVQCGVGRTGTLWAHEFSGVTPDLMALAKPLASGLPIGAALMTDKVHETVSVGDHGSTFAGGNVVCAVANVVFDEVNTPSLLAHVNELGEYTMERLAEINSPHIKEVRGKGLMIGIEFDFAATEVVQAGYDAGFLLVNAGEHTLRLVPPLIVEKSHIDQFVNFLTEFLAHK